MAAAKKYEADKKANEVKEYGKHVDALIERRQLEIKALDGLVQVCRKFDGKVLNKRFHDAVKEATGFYSSFGEYCFELNSYDYYDFIEFYKNGRLAKIEELKASKKKYAAYLRLARKAEAIMKDMEGYDYEIREFAKENGLSQYSRYSYFWKGY